jgi:transcription initiation factor TFIID TATA-box-binding protein
LFAQASKKSQNESLGFTSHKMDAIQTHPSNAAQAKAFTAPGSLSFPGGANEFANPAAQANGNVNGNGMPTNGVQQQGVQATNGTGVTPATPAATPGAGSTGPSGITPTLQ